VSYSQDSESSSQKTDRAELVSRCEAAAGEVTVSRALISKYKQTLSAKEDELEKARKLQTASDEQIVRLQEEIVLIRQSLASERLALSESQAALKGYKKALSKMTKKKNFFKGLAKVLAVTTAVAGGIAAALILKQ
jgi:chromosome segregation ATPase